MRTASESFGAYVRDLRQHKRIGQRALARKLGISPSYLNDIEKNNRAAPRPELVKSILATLDANPDRIFDLAGESRGDLPADVREIIRNRPRAIELLRAIGAYGLDDSDVAAITGTIMASNTKVLIVAAGMGTRMKGHTEDKPKCMVEFSGKTLLQRQLDAYRECGLNNISLVRGYKKEKIDYPGLTYFENLDYESNNILNSIFYGEPAIDGHVIIAYSDILFESHVVDRLLQSDHDISIVVDIDWRGYYVDRRDHPIEEAENVVFDANNDVVETGKILTKKDDVHGEFIGMMKLTPRGADIFKRHFHRAKALYWNKPFQRAKRFQSAYLTDMIQEMVDLGVHVHCVIIERGWKEIDTVEDYEKALIDFADGESRE